MTTRATLDRIEEDIAVLVVEGRQVTRPLRELPPGVREGDVLDLDTLEVDHLATEALREEVRRAREKAARGKKPPPTGNFDL